MTHLIGAMIFYPFCAVGLYILMRLYQKDAHEDSNSVWSEFDQDGYMVRFWAALIALGGSLAVTNLWWLAAGILIIGGPAAAIAYPAYRWSKRKNSKPHEDS